MKAEANYFKIGLFVVLALILLVIGLIAFSTEFWVRNTITFESYFDESVQGLSVGSAVLQQGVNIGRVKQITFVTQEYSQYLKPGTPEYDKFSNYVLVIMEINQNQFPFYNENLEEFKLNLREMIHRGLRVRLTYQGITGLASLEMAVISQAKPPLMVPWVPRNYYIPSTPSLITSFTTAVEQTFERLEKIDIEGAVDQLILTLKDFDTALGQAHIKELSSKASALMEDIQKTSTQLRDKIQNMTDPNLPGNLPEAIAQFTQITSQINRLIDINKYDVDEIINNLKAVSQSLRGLLDRLEEDPALLFFSSPPAKSEVFK